MVMSKNFNCVKSFDQFVQLLPGLVTPRYYLLAFPESVITKPCHACAYAYNFRK